MLKRIILHAPNVHTGGGLVLLIALLRDWPAGLELIALLDVRARDKICVPDKSTIKWVHPRVGSRLAAEFFLRKLDKNGGTILCFHGLPPVLPMRSRVLVFLQNRLLIEAISWGGYKWRTRIRLGIERFIFRSLYNRVDSFVVQTPTMHRRLLEWRKGAEPHRPVKVLPFSGAASDGGLPRQMRIEWDFVYVADGQAHKNHLALLEAWRELALEGIKPRLALTLTSRDGHLINAVNTMRAECGANIHSIGQISHQEVQELYRRSRALIFPSQFESFGLPLVEAHELGLPILASELDYVRDVCSPVQTFDPNSPLSIVRAVKRFLDIPESMSVMYSPRDFLRALFETEPE